MRTSFTPRSRRRSSLGASVILSVALFAATGFGAVGAGASTQQWAAPSPFCSTVLSLAAAKPTPPSTNPTQYHQWLTKYLPKFETLEAQAPNAQVKTALHQMVTIMQSQGKTSSVTQLKKLVAAHQAAWAGDFRALLKAVTGCVTSLY